MLPLEIVEACIQFGANDNAGMLRGRTALHWAVLSGNASIVKQLLNPGGDPEIKYAKK
jgi:ankyrin repeat protein